MTADELKQQLQLPDLSQIGVVVEDLDRVASFLEASFGLGPFDVRELEAPNVWDRGEEKHIKARIGSATLGQVELELIQIIEGDSVQLEFLRQHGEGLHHLGFRVKDFEAKLQQARAMGLELLQTGPLGHFYAYLDARRHGGFIFELIDEANRPQPG
jgi:4-hydroxyphenylpyruvate dioxygenase-like putative hemolysin